MENKLEVEFLVRSLYLYVIGVMFFLNFKYSNRQRNRKYDIKVGKMNFNFNFLGSEINVEF